MGVAIRVSRDVREANEAARIRIQPSSGVMNGRWVFWWSMTVPTSSGRRSNPTRPRCSTGNLRAMDEQTLASIRSSMDAVVESPWRVSGSIVEGVS